MELLVPGKDALQLAHIVLDVNGTVASGGRLIEGVRERLLKLRTVGFEVHWITADTRGRQAVLDSELGWPAERLTASGHGSEAGQKAAFVRSLGARTVVAIGNGSNDSEMLREAAVGIAVVGPEGLALDALLASDVIMPSIGTALDLLLDPDSLIATLRK
jgi:P-type E1-E2 ATPase